MNYREITSELIESLEKDRDRAVLTKRYGLDGGKGETLDKIGRRYGITRERVRQIERAALKKLSSLGNPKTKAINQWLIAQLAKEGGVATLETLTTKIADADAAILYFLARVAPGIEVIEEDKRFNTTLLDKQMLSSAQVVGQVKTLVDAFKTRQSPAPLKEVASSKLGPAALTNIARSSKELAHFGEVWGLKAWPTVNPRSIKDRAYLALKNHRQPLHFSEIATHITRITPSGRKVTTQAVHNELIKDERFVLIGRGIYALSDWGYTAGTVADMIIEVLRLEQPLHKDEIVRRVLEKRQVKVTTIALNLQEKKHFERVAKATYKLRP